MTKLRLKFEAIVDYEPDPQHYPDNARTPEEMLSVDLINANDDPFSLLEVANITVTGEIIEP